MQNVEYISKIKNRKLKEMKRIATLMIVLIGMCGIGFAQGDYEAFTFSQADYLGTARFMGAGGAFGATGGDFSAVSTNPASIGLYKRHEVSFTPMQLLFGYSDTYYNQQKASAQNFKYTVPQCGIVLANTIHRDNGWKSWQFGFGYNRIMDFNSSYRANAQVMNTIGNEIAMHANGTDYNNLTGDGYLAWMGWMMDTVPGYHNFYQALYGGHDINQKATVVRSGAINEMTITFGGNYNDKFFVGATLGFPFIDFREKTNYYEQPADAYDIGNVTEYALYTQQRNSGAGVNLKLGVIYQPAEFVRLGLGFHTPTYYWNIKDYFYRELYTEYVNIPNLPNSRFNYENRNNFTLTTPLKFNASASFLIKKRAFIAAEYEFENYSMASLYNDNYDYSNENEMIKMKYGISHNLRVGAEVNITQGFSLRAGYRLKTSPYKMHETTYNGTAHFISAGVGFRGKFFFCDLAYMLRMSKDSYWLYDPVGEPCQVKTNTHYATATIGWKF